MRTKGYARLEMGVSAGDASEAVADLADAVFGLSTNDKQRISIKNSRSFLGYSFSNGRQVYDMALPRKELADDVEKCLSGANLYPRGTMEIAEVANGKLEGVVQSVLETLKNDDLGVQIQQLDQTARHDRVRLVLPAGKEADIGLPLTSLLEVHFVTGEAMFRIDGEGTAIEFSATESTVVVTTTNPALMDAKSPSTVSVACPEDGTCVATYAVQVDTTETALASLRQAFPETAAKWYGTPKGETAVDRLCRLFESVDASLIYYYATSRINDTIGFSALRRRVADHSRLDLYIEDLQRIKTIWPDAYSVSEPESAKTKEIHVAASNLPAKATQRRARFGELCDQWLERNPLASDVPLAGLFHMSSDNKENVPPKRALSDRAEMLRKKLRPEHEVKPKKEGTLLERIRAKEQAMRLHDAAGEQAEQRFKFLQAQMVSVGEVLAALTVRSGGTSVSLSLDQLHAKIHDSMRTRLSRKEVESVLVLLCQRLPQFCVLIAVGAVRAIRVSAGWTRDSLRTALSGQYDVPVIKSEHDMPRIKTEDQEDRPLAENVHIKVEDVPIKTEVLY